MQKLTIYKEVIGFDFSCSFNFHPSKNVFSFPLSPYISILFNNIHFKTQI